MNKVLVCGSIAIDLLGTYGGSFEEYQDKYPINALNFSLQLRALRTSFGGCGMNITYGLSQLGVPCLPLSAAGANFDDHYREHLTGLGVNIDHIAVDRSFEQCATAIVLSDQHGNQITGFYAGAATSPMRKLPSEIAEIGQVRIAVLAPEDAPIMLRQARDLHQLGIPVLFDPGQGISEFSETECAELLDLCDYVIANGHEWEIIQMISGRPEADIVAAHKQVIVTHSADGACIKQPGQDDVWIPALQAEQMVEVTGSGDAFRAGYVFGLVHGLTPEQCGRAGALTALYNVEAHETQRYRFSLAEFGARYAAAWGESLPVL